MNVSILLILLLVGAVATFFSGNKLASKVALFFSVAIFGYALMLLNRFNIGFDISYLTPWIVNPNVSMILEADGLSMAMVLLTLALTPIIIYSSFANNFNNSKTIYALILFMAFAMTGTFLAEDGLLYYIFWELSLIPIYFIALVWGNGDLEERKKAVVKFFIYTLAGSLFMLVAFAYLYDKAGSFMLSDLTKLNLSVTEQFWIFFALTNSIPA
jgi:NADH-quinone oxidoreductase subunit M